MFERGLEERGKREIGRPLAFFKRPVISRYLFPMTPSKFPAMYSVLAYKGGVRVQAGRYPSHRRPGPFGSFVRPIGLDR